MQTSKLLSVQVIVLIVLLLVFDTFAQLAFKIAVTQLGEFPLIMSVQSGIIVYN